MIVADEPIIIIGGLDPSGGAGISMDIRAAAVFNIPCALAITGLALQTNVKGFSVEITPPEIFRSNIECCFSTPAKAVKLGMLGTGKIAEIVLAKLREYPKLPVVVDPVIYSTSGMQLIDEKGLAILVEKIFPCADLITPNWSECEILTGTKIENLESAITAGKKLYDEIGTAILVKGGHSPDMPIDVLINENEIEKFPGTRIRGNFRGTGCALATLIASGLAKGRDIQYAVRTAKKVIERGMSISSPPYLIFGNYND